jgi:2-(1,2-epoxy-1,2-dihydrophenyl)acetyl-CoA isomerase
VDYSDLRVDRPAEHVLRVAIDRPRTRNAYTSQTCRELAHAVEQFGCDDTLRALVLTGTGASFCSGGDLRSTEEVETAESRQLGHAMVMREGMHRVVLALHRLDKPTIAAVNGVAVAGGLTLALACDLRLGAADARLGDTSGRVGLLPDEGGAWLFPRVMGLDRALRMTLLQEVYDAPRALELGLLTEVVPAAELSDAAIDLASRLAAAAPLAVRVAKRMMARSASLTLEQSLQDAELAVVAVNDSADVAEGVAAFVEKRRPTFVGR